MSVATSLETATHIHRAFEAQVRRTPEASALIFENLTLSYDALNRRANQLARALQRRGIQVGALVGICVHPSLEMVVGLLGILKAGGAYLPLDPAYPAERLAFMREDAQADLLLTVDALVSTYHAGDAPVVCLDSGWPSIASEDDTDLMEDDRTPDLAYVIYTSGSTGRPKGVEITHRGVCSNLNWRQETFPLSSQDKLLQTYSFSFDPSVWAFFWPLTCGATVVLPRPGGSGDPAYLVETIAERQITVLGFSPSLLSILLERPDIEHCTTLRHVFCGGESLTPGLARRFYAKLEADLHNVYGPTEATIDAAWWTCERVSEDQIVPIGHSLPRTKIYLLDEAGNRVLPGTPGELHVTGAGVALGYRNRPDLTRDRFITNPFDRDDFPFLYRTGDLARQRHDGAFEYLGRLDQQVKIRGFRIELGEIEEALTRFFGIREAVVTVREDRADDKRLVAYLVADTDPEPSVAALAEHLRKTLPVHMLPSAYVFLSVLPLSANGKLDVRQLPRPRYEDRIVVPPETPSQRQLAALFEELLGIDGIGIHDGFFDLGGHSLLAAQLIARIERVFECKLPMALLRDAATVAQLAKHLEVTEEYISLSPLMERISDGSSHPLFFWHGSFTGGLYCKELAGLLGTKQPLYAIAPHGMDGTAIPATIEAMAAEHLTLLRTIQPSGPYRLGGFCNGGLVAYEAARQLRASGEYVEFLALIEMCLPPTRIKLCLHRAVFRVGRLLRLPPEVCSYYSVAMQARTIFLLLALKKARRAVEVCKQMLRRSVHSDWDALIPERYRNTAVFYHLLPYNGPVTLVVVEDTVRQSLFPPEIGWQELTASLTVDIIPGDHYGSLAAHLPELAARLKARLDALQPKP